MDITVDIIKAACKSSKPRYGVKNLRRGQSTSGQKEFLSKGGIVLIPAENIKEQGVDL